MRVTIVGGGILGTTHALEAVGRGHEVVQLEREAEARGATVRNFGLIWVSGRATDELAATLRSRELWEKLGAEIPGIYDTDDRLRQWGTATYTHGEDGSLAQGVVARHQHRWVASRVPHDEAGRKAGCRKSARPV